MEMRMLVRCGVKLPGSIFSRCLGGHSRKYK